LTRPSGTSKVVDDFGEPYIPQASKPQCKGEKIMGDKSPKSVNKKATQKQSKSNTASQVKKQAEVAKSAAGKKR
jgi:hypothetical protein